MIHIKTINSEVEIQKDIIASFKKQRIIDQTACYLNNGKDRYYNPSRTNMQARYSGSKYDYSKMAQLLQGILSEKKGTKTAIISLGCGSCETDKIVLEHLQEMGYNFSFFGADSSMAMLHKANDVLSDVTFECTLICANFGAFNFREELDKIIGDYDLGIYLFLGNTLGNLNQSYIADILKNILQKEDYLLLDVIGFETITTPIQAQLFKRYKGYLSNPADAEFYLGPLKDFGIPVDCGKLVLKTTEDNVTQAQVFAFGFKAHTSISFSLEKEKVSLSPNEYVNLHNVLIYDLGELVKFLRTKEFEIKERLLGNYHNQLLLQKQ